MMQNDENNEYNEFWIKFAKNAEELFREYNKLSPTNKRRADMDAWKIVTTRGLMGLWEYLKTLL